MTNKIDTATDNEKFTILFFFLSDFYFMMLQLKQIYFNYFFQIRAQRNTEMP